MYVNIAVLKETRAHECRVALMPSVIPKLVKLGARLHMQTGAASAIPLEDAAFADVAFIADRADLVKDADVVLCVQPPALEVIDAMKEGAILVSFVYAHNEPALVQRMVDRKITCFAMERVPRISRAQAMDALSSQSALAGYYAVQIGSTHLARVVPKITSAAGSAPWSRATTSDPRRANRRCRSAPPSSTPAWTRPGKAAMRANSAPRNKPRSPPS
jgi:NAD(P) transhydrogenase subunit alpha